MENLTKQQIVLVTLLVSFVTSIATGIVTVSLMDQAPAGVTQTINRVVERTIEKVIQTPSQSAAVVTKETVIIKEDDMVMQAVENGARSIARIGFRISGSQVLTLGVVLTKDGIIAVDARSILPGPNYEAMFSTDKTYPIERVFNYESKELALYKVVLPEGEKVTFVTASLADSDKLKLGQAVVFIGGDDAGSVDTGIVSNLKYKKQDILPQATTTLEIPPPLVIGISTNIGRNSAVGGVLSNLSSEIVAYGVSRGGIVFLPVNVLKDALNAYREFQASLKTAQEAVKAQ